MSFIYALVPVVMGLYLHKSGRLNAIPAQGIVLALHAATILSTFVFIATFGSSLARFYAFLASFLSTVVAMLANYGLPGRANYQAWISQAAQGADFPFFMFSSIFLSAQSVGLGDVLGLFIVGRRALWAIGLALEKLQTDRSLIKRGQGLWRAVRANEAVVLRLMALFEIFIGFYLIAILLTPSRQIFTIFVYWNFLRLRFNAPRSRQLHTEAWTLLGGWARPLTNHELVGKGVDKVKTWFRQ